jgi:hypothetical protein
VVTPVNDIEHDAINGKRIVGHIDGLPWQIAVASPFACHVAGGKRRRRQ